MEILQRREMEINHVTEPSYAYYMVVFGNTDEILQENMNILINQLKELNLPCHTEKTKTMKLGDGSAKHNIK